MSAFERLLDRIRRRAPSRASTASYDWCSDDVAFWDELEAAVMDAYRTMLRAYPPGAARNAQRRYLDASKLQRLFPRGRPPPLALLRQGDAGLQALVPANLELLCAAVGDFVAILVADHAERVLHGLLIADARRCLGEQVRERLDRLRGETAAGGAAAPSNEPPL